MKPAFLKLNFSLAALIVLLAVFSASAQPTAREKQIEAKAAYDEGIKFRDENTFRSYKAALEKFQLSARLYEEIGDRGNAASSLLGVGFIQSLLDENAAALENYQKALAVFREVGHKALEARTLNNIGRLYDEAGEKQKALEYHFQALPLRKITGDRHGEGLTLNSIGAVYSGTGERQKALEYYTQSLAIRQELGEIYEQAITLNNIGQVYEDLGEIQKGLDFLNRSLVLRRSVGDKNGEAVVLNNIGLATYNRGESAKAIEYLRQAIDIYSSLGLETVKATVLNNIATAYLNLAEPRKALEYSRRALSLHLTSGDKGGAAAALSNIGRANLELGNIPQSLNDLNQALVFGKASQEKELEALILANLMHASKKAGQLRTAVFYGKQSVNKYQELRQYIQSLDPQTQKSYLDTVEGNYRSLADLLIEAGLFAQAEQILRMLKEEEYFDFVGRDASEIKNLGQRVEMSLKEYEVIKRYSLLADRITVIGQEFSRLDEKKRRLSRRDENLPAEEQKTYDDLSAQLSDANSVFKLFLEKQLLRELGKAEINKIEYDRNLQTKLAKWGKGTVALYTVVTPDRYRVILTTPTVQIDGKSEIKIAELNKKIFAFREALRNRAADPRPPAKELYDILVKPIEKELQAAGAKTLLWSLDGALRYIPLAALSPDGKSYLIEKYTNTILTPKTRDDVFGPSGEWHILGFGVSQSLSVANPDDPEKKISFRALPGAKKELTEIVREENVPAETGILAGRRFLDKDFTMRTLSDSLAKENEDGKKKFTVIHIASHFRLGSDWSNSFLLLGDGNILTLEQLSNSPEISFGEMELVTLSACNTAFASDSNGKEIDSLAEAIQTKSGKAILATLWSISDEGTSLLMGEFYRLRKEAPELTKAEALQTAQRSLIAGKAKIDPALARSMKPDMSLPENKTPSPAFAFDEAKPFAHPYYWSPFILIGNWR